MNRSEAVKRSIDRDPIRAFAYESAVGHSNPRALVLLPERFLPLVHEAVRKMDVVGLGMCAREDQQELVDRLREELSDEQRADLETISELDELFYREYQEATA